jgi:hypothetical protein
MSRFKLTFTIPAPVNYKHLGLLGLCNPKCPFHRNDEQSGYACTMGMSVVSEHKHNEDPTDDGNGGPWSEQVMKPGPKCPRHQEKKNV